MLWLINFGLVCRAEAILHSLPLLVQSSLQMKVRNPVVAFRQGIYRVRTPQLEAGLVLTGNLDARIEDRPVLKSACRVKSSRQCISVVVVATGRRQPTSFSRSLKMLMQFLKYMNNLSLLARTKSPSL